MAMVNRMPVVSTPYHFALEVLQDSRGIVIPYNDYNGTMLTKALCVLLEDASLRDEMVCYPVFCLHPFDNAGHEVNLAKCVHLAATFMASSLGAT